jgi:hypothetical protein
LARHGRGHPPAVGARGATSRCRARQSRPDASARTTCSSAAAKAGVRLIVWSAAQGPKVRRLFAGGRWIRTFGSRTRHLAVRPKRGRFPVIGSSPHWPGGTGISNLRPLARVDLCVKEALQKAAASDRDIICTGTDWCAWVGGMKQLTPGPRVSAPSTGSRLAAPRRDRGGQKLLIPAHAPKRVDCRGFGQPLLRMSIHNLGAGCHCRDASIWMMQGSVPMTASPTPRAGRSGV